MEKQKERDRAYSEWSNLSHQRSMEAIENHYTSRWFLEYSKYMDAEREKAKEEYSIEQLKQPVLSYEEFVEKREKIVADRALNGDMLPSGQTEKPEKATTEYSALSIDNVSLDSNVGQQVDTAERDAAHRIVTKKSYERMTDKEKAEWIGISDSDMDGSVQRFKDKMAQIGIWFRSIPEMTEAFMDVWKGTTESSNHDFEKRKIL